MITLECEIEPLAADVAVTDSDLRVRLADGRTILVPLSWLPRLEHGTAEERSNWQLVGGGYGIEWPDLDEHVLVEGLLAGRRSRETDASLRRWLNDREKGDQGS